jgi:ketosteroid isomerase-like protein
MNQADVTRVDQELMQIAEGFAAAERQGDTAYMERTLTGDFLAIGPRGFLLNKEQWLQRFTSGSLKYEYLEWDEANVRTYGDAAVVTGRERQKVTYQGQGMEMELRTTLVWVKQSGRWLLASAAMSPILDAPREDRSRGA